MRGGMPKKTVCPLFSCLQKVPQRACRPLSPRKKATLSERVCYSLRAITLIAPEPPPKETSRWDNINPKLDYCTHAATPLHRYISKLHCLGYYLVLYHYTIIPLGIFIFCCRGD